MEKCGLEAASAVFPIMAVPERKGSRNCLTFRMDMTNSPRDRHGVSPHTDPVCGGEVREDTPWKAGYQGKTYFFCSRACRDKFTQTPEEILRAKTVPADKLSACRDLGQGMAEGLELGIF